MEEADLEYMRDKLEYLHLKSDFFDGQTEVWGKLINIVELEQKESLKEEQELIDKFNERQIEKEKLISHLKSLKKQVKVSSNSSLNNGKKEVKNNDTVFTRINGFFNCTECDFKVKKISIFIVHTNAVHRKLKPNKCSDCDKAFSTKSVLTSHQKNIHATQKDWACDCCGSSFGTKSVLKNHMKTHLPPSFACSKCSKKFVYAYNLKDHLMRHAGILNQVCKFCNKGHSTKNGLETHIARKHFSKMYCEVQNCSYKCGTKSDLIAHLKGTHKHSDKNMIEHLLKDLEKLKPDFQKMMYVNKSVNCK